MSESVSDKASYIEASLLKITKTLFNPVLVISVLGFGLNMLHFRRISVIVLNELKECFFMRALFYVSEVDASIVTRFQLWKQKRYSPHPLIVAFWWSYG